MTAKRCAIYARLSVTKEESVSIARQLESCRKYAEGRGWEVVGEFVDDGVSATANRPEDRAGWAALLETRDVDAVVIWKVDRLARRVLDFLHVDGALQERGAALVAVEDPIDMTTPMGRAFATILAVFGEMEAAAISSRVKAARQHILTEGRFAGGGVPYGFTAVDNPEGAGRVLAHDPERIDWLRRMVWLAMSGETVGTIVKLLDDECAPLPANRPRREGSNSGWNRQTIENLLRNPTLAGMTPRNPGRKRSGKQASPSAVLRDDEGDPIVNHTLAVVTLAEFDTLLHLLDSRGTAHARKQSERRTTSPFLSRVAVCDDCDATMCRGTNQGKPTLYCPRCRQTIGRTSLDPWITRKLLRQRGAEDVGGITVRERWQRCGSDETARREVLVSQVNSLRIRRGAVGLRFDPNRVLIEWVSTAPAVNG